MRLDDIADVMADAIAAAQAPLLARLAILEAKGAPAAIVGEKGADGAPGRDAEVDLEALARAAAALIPVPKDGVDGKDGRDGIDGKDGVGLPGEKGADGRDGLPGVPGRDGADGLHGKDGAQGPAGTDGRDGTLEQLKAVYDGERTVTLCHKDGTALEGGVIVLAGLTLYRGIYDSERAYATGDQVTYGGSQWTAKADSRGRQPGTNDGAPYWQLSAKKGNDGRSGKDGKDGKPGRDGKNWGEL
jgi:hypothetical protein